jgi:EAL and modified HD-GYP domain-containing signal transduction protein
MVGGRPVHDAARVVEVDVAGLDRGQLERRVRATTPSGATLLARNVDDYATYELCRELGFDYFQGSFFLRPKAIDGDGVPASKLSKLGLVAALQDPEVELEELERIIAHDVGLSYRLLRTINSGYFFLPNRVASIHDALVLLGRRNVRTWATLVLLSDVDDRPSELLVTAMVRARLCELVARERGHAPVDSFFTVGLFSVIDAFVDAPLETILESLPFSEEIVGALLRHEGGLGRALGGVVAYEQGRFGAAEELLPEVPIRDLYLDAVRFADESGDSLAGLR